MEQLIATVPLGVTRALSQAIFEALSEEDATQGDSICACALTLGRLMAPTTLSSEQEVKCVQDIVQWVGTYWASHEGMN